MADHGPAGIHELASLAIRRLLRAARCRIVAGRGRRTITSAREVGGNGVSALFARQRRRRAGRAERARPTGHAGSLASLFLIRARLAIIASDHFRVGSHGPTAACCWLVNAWAAKVPRRTGVALLLGLQLARIAKLAGGARECHGAALRTVVCLWASCWLHPLLTTAAEVKPAGHNPAQVALDVPRLVDQVWGGAPVARLVGGGGLAGTRWAAGVVIVVGVCGAACSSRGRSASVAGMVRGARLPPDLAPSRRHPVARWRGQHIGCCAAGA
eukprot:scaffold42418_cov69-Phaeocystis_antarctica.AAC.1